MIMNSASRVGELAMSQDHRFPSKGMMVLAATLAVVACSSSASIAQSLTGSQSALPQAGTQVAQLETIDAACSPVRVGATNVTACRLALAQDRNQVARRGARVTIRSCRHLGCKGVHFLGVGY